jgi:hypothetical protein
MAKGEGKDHKEGNDDSVAKEEHERTVVHDSGASSQGFCSKVPPAQPFSDSLHEIQTIRMVFQESNKNDCRLKPGLFFESPSSR